jgi:hypothetical protein
MVFSRILGNDDSPFTCRIKRELEGIRRSHGGKSLEINIPLPDFG